MRIAAPLLALVLSAAASVPALAHDYYDRHARHRDFHYDVGRAHARAHAEVFYSYREHRAYHRALRDLHRHFNNDHPGTYHDHYTWRRY